MSVRAILHKRQPPAYWSAAFRLTNGECLTWHGTDEEGRPADPLFSVERHPHGWLLREPNGHLLGCFASLDAARDTGFRHVEGGISC